MKTFYRVTMAPVIPGGQPTLGGMRLTFGRVVEAVALCAYRYEVYVEYPELEPEDVRRALEFAAYNPMIGRHPRSGLDRVSPGPSPSARRNQAAR